jgi:uncharacterized repeat protein (TIGR04076 family)
MASPPYLGGKEMKVDEQLWEMVQKQLGYTDEEMNLFKQDPRNSEVLSKIPESINKRIVAEVVESHGCLSQHNNGDRFVLDAAGNLLSSMCPERMCSGAVSVLATPVFTAAEFLLAGVDPNEMKFKRVGCPDVGLHCGGWGRIVMEIRVEDGNP